MMRLVQSLLLVVAVAAGCAAPSRPTTTEPSAAGSAPRAEQPAAPKRMVIGIAANVPTLVERLSAGGANVPGLVDIEKMISPGLTVVAESGDLRGLLAEAAPSLENRQWVLLPDGRMETTWRIRPGVLWHDGAPFTADDAVFTSMVDRDADIPMRRSLGYASVDRIEAVDPQTVTVHWRQAYIQADALFDAPFFPRHLLERAYLDDKAAFPRQAYFTGEFVGTGAFKLQQFVLGSHMVLAPNERYVLGRPRLDEIDVRFIPDPSTLVANVLADAVDLTLGRGISIDQALQVRDLWKNGRSEITFTSWLVSYPQFLNPNPSVVADFQFRRALMLATDRQQMAETLQAGMVPIAHTFLAPAEPEYLEVEREIVKYEYDPRQAVQIIEGLGYSRGADGIFRDGSGHRLAVEVRTTPEQDIHSKTILALADSWQRVGVATDPVVIAEQRVREREYFQTFPGFLTIRQPNDPKGYPARLHGNQTPLPTNTFVGRNHPRYMNPEFDALVDRYFATIPRHDRTQVLGQIIRHTTERLTLMGLFYDVEPLLIANRLRGVAARKAADSTSAWNVEQWEIAN